jgi:D-lactate dehydrogenase (cytochrome)
MDAAPMAIATRSPRGVSSAATTPVTDAARLQQVLEDAAHTPDGSALGVVTPADEAGVAEVLRSAARVLPIGAQSSLTGGATPRGDVVLSTSGMRRIRECRDDIVRVEAGVTLDDLQAALAARGAAYPPAPTWLGATVGGIIATNAAGAATFKYGTTRDWVRGLTVVLATGDVLEIERGQVRAEQGRFEIDASAGRVLVPVPTYRMPDVPKRSAGYHAAPGMDLVDLFVGSEGTLGIVTEATLRVLQPAPAPCLALVPCASERQALDLVRELRDEARETWRTHDPRGLDVCAVEMMDRRSLALVREDGADVRAGVPVGADTDTLLLVQIDLPPGTTTDDVYGAIAEAADGGGDGPLARFCRTVDRRGLLDAVELAGPGDTRRIAQFHALREAVPAAVNARVARAQATVDPRITKTAGDMIVPWAHFGEALAMYRTGFERRGLDHATWGHASDGNVHPNVIPRSFADVEAGREAILEFGQWVVGRGGSPLAEHGVGRSPVKQALLRMLYGEAGIEQMRAVKRALDPDGRLAAGVLFP